MKDKYGTSFSTVLIGTGLLCFFFGLLSSCIFIAIDDIPWWFGFILAGILWVGVSICNFFAFLFGI